MKSLSSSNHCKSGRCTLETNLTLNTQVKKKTNVYGIMTLCCWIMQYYPNWHRENFCRSDTVLGAELTRNGTVIVSAFVNLDGIKPRALLHGKPDSTPELYPSPGLPILKINQERYKERYKIKKKRNRNVVTPFQTPPWLMSSLYTDWLDWLTKASQGSAPPRAKVIEVCDHTQLLHGC